MRGASRKLELAASPSSRYRDLLPAGEKEACAKPLPENGRFAARSGGKEVLTGGRAPAPAVKAGSAELVENGRHLVDRHVTRVDLAIDDEGRRGVDAKVLGAALPHCIHIIQKLLVRQAGVESFL